MGRRPRELSSMTTTLRLGHVSRQPPGSHPRKAGILQAAGGAKPGRQGKFEVDIYELPYADGYLQVQFNSPVMLKPATGPIKDAIIASFQVQ